MAWQDLGDKPRPPARKDVGTIGRKIRLQVNFFPVQIKNPNLELVHYDVVIDDVRKKDIILPRKKKLLIFEAMKAQYPKVFGGRAFGYDAEKNAYSVSRIPQLKKGFEYEVDYKDEEFRTTFKYKVKLTIVNHAYVRDLMNSFKPTPESVPEGYKTVYQMLEVLFQHSPAVQYDRVGRNTFYSTVGEFGQPFPIGGGKESVVGFFNSLKPCSWKNGSLLLNIDISHTAYYKEQSVLDFMKESLGFYDTDFNGPLKPAKSISLVKGLKGLKIQVTHTPVKRTYRVSGVSPLGADRQTFPLEDPNTKQVSPCTVADYFQMQYRQTLKYRRLNCLKVGPENRNIYIPIECCRIGKGQKVNKKLSDKETANMIRATAKRPMERLESVCRIAKTKNFSNDDIIKALQFTIADQPLRFDGRVLPPPKLMMDQIVEPRQGVWDARDRRYFNGADLNSWVIMNYDPRSVNRGALERFMNFIRRMGDERGMSISVPIIRESWSPNPESEFLEIKQRVPDVQLILVILPRSTDIYPRVKKVGDRVIHVVTQCIKSTNVPGKPDIVGNVLLKINAKMGGINTVIGDASTPFILTKPVMIMGADVNHPPAGDKSTPSLAAVVASIDRYASKYAVEVRHQKHRTEMIQDMREMTKNLLKGFFRATRRKPERIVMFRDGVSESQFLEVLSYELKAMRDACTELERDYTPAITFLVVQKRHHTRLFCDERDGVGKSKNIPPGTTVDVDITHPYERDFYLCSHQGIQGTSRPTHYHVLWDDSDLTMDQLQTLTYAMCHLYSRCTRSVSIPTPAYYAHLAAFRAKVHIADLCHSETSSLASGEAAGGPTDAAINEACSIRLGCEIFSKLYYV